MIDEIRAAGLQAASSAAREALACRLEENGHDSVARNVRAGQHDDVYAIKHALLGADAAIAAIAPLIRRECAEVALGELDAANCYPDLARNAALDAGKEVAKAILALNEKGRGQPMTADTLDDDLSVFPEHDDDGRAAAARVLNDAGLDGPVAVNETASREPQPELTRMDEPQVDTSSPAVWALALQADLAALDYDLPALGERDAERHRGYHQENAATLRALAAERDAAIARAEAAEAWWDALVSVAEAARGQREAAAAVSAMIGHRPVGGDRQRASLDLGAANRALWAALDALPPSR